MALPVNIDDIIQQRKVERTRIEYKSEWDPEPIIHTITAFANDFDNMGGGYVLIGVEEENGRPRLPVKGLDPDSIDTIQNDLLDKCNFIEPRCIPTIETCTINNKEILALWIPGGDERPYKCPEKLHTRRGRKKVGKSYYYIRKGARTLKANEREEQELISMVRDVPFDDRINYHADVADIRPALIADHLRIVGSDHYEKAFNRSVEEITTDMQIIKGPSEYKKPLNVGLMFFNEHPERYFPLAQIEVVDKPDPTGVGMTEKIFTGPLDRQLQNALSYIRNNFIKEYVTKMPDNEQAMRTFNWPYQAVEEALCNAVYHRSYQISEPITVTITPEKMEILSFPGPDCSITDNDLQKRILVSRRYRNRRIGNFLKELGIVEGRNTGVPLIVSSMEKNGSELPVFETDEERSYFLTTLPIHPLFRKSAKTYLTETKKGTRRRRDELGTLIIKILTERGNMSANKVAAALGYKKLTDTLRSVIKDLAGADKIAYLYPEKSRSRNQKIFIKTDKRAREEVSR